MIVRLVNIMMQGQIVTISFFRFAKRADKFWAFKMMQLAHEQIANEAKGLSFYKLLGSGGEDGFSWKPNFSVYGLLCVWDSLDHASHFFKNSNIFQEYTSKSQEFFTTYMQAIKSHGAWSGQSPFEELVKEHNGKIAIITRATIKTGKLAYFWSKVAGVSESLVNYPGRQFSIGIGEWPLVQQATFSIWDSYKHMAEYAYKNPMHKKVIRLTREKGWYKEELFARFAPLKVAGTWDGKKADFLSGS
jgi:hypothetical protein